MLAGALFGGVRSVFRRGREMGSGIAGGLEAVVVAIDMAIDRSKVSRSIGEPAGSRRDHVARGKLLNT